VARVQALPGGESAAIANYVPLSGHWGSVGFSIEGRPPLAAGDFLIANSCTVSPSYFETMKIPIIDGRGFTAADRLKAPQVVTINQALARRFFPNENPIGKRLNFASAETPDFCEIIGVVGDVKHFGPDAEPRPQIYVSHLQSPSKWMSLIVRAVGNPLNLVASARTAGPFARSSAACLRHSNSGKLVSQSIAPRRFAMLLLAGFAVVALSVGRNWDLRSHLLRREQTHARDRHPHGARRATPRCAGLGGQARDEARAHWSGRRASRALWLSRECCKRCSSKSNLSIH
jgi:putative ABC transport system permease protein